ncbi:hypothetical protein HO173_011869 [Letharia columbiana]|uniref:Uncharacterized protein n=1 Tax=Letharia columbiana TaxID=112416 RepID=A0A8H6CSM6_9LECA|nr:uncharacterized protein HO173_011869 [Letharia columbiana]KAF6228566.1 hypothetical protein HO173_011869 [Letharia columbiana]
MSSYFSSSGYVLLLVSSIIATLTVALRFWARRIRKIRLELNDYLIVLGLVFALAEVIVDIYGSPSSLTLKMYWSANDPHVQEIDAGNYQAAYSFSSYHISSGQSP